MAVPASAISTIISYDRTANAYKTLSVDGGVLQLNAYSGGNVGIGTLNPQYLLSVNGTVGAKDVIVTNTGWSDSVFGPATGSGP